MFLVVFHSSRRTHKKARRCCVWMGELVPRTYQAPPWALQRAWDAVRIWHLASMHTDSSQHGMLLFLQGCVIRRIRIKRRTVCNACFTILKVPNNRMIPVFLCVEALWEGSTEEGRIKSRIGLNRICTPYMTVYLVISLPKTPYMHRIWTVLANSNKETCSRKYSGEGHAKDEGLTITRVGQNHIYTVHTRYFWQRIHQT